MFSPRTSTTVLHDQEPNNEWDDMAVELQEIKNQRAHQNPVANAESNVTVVKQPQQVLPLTKELTDRIATLERALQEQKTEFEKKLQEAKVENTKAGDYIHDLENRISARDKEHIQETQSLQAALAKTEATLTRTQVDLFNTQATLRKRQQHYAEQFSVQEQMLSALEAKYAKTQEAQFKQALLRSELEKQEANPNAPHTVNMHVGSDQKLSFPQLSVTAIIEQNFREQGINVEPDTDQETVMFHDDATTFHHTEYSTMQSISIPKSNSSSALQANLKVFKPLERYWPTYPNNVRKQSGEGSELLETPQINRDIEPKKTL